MKGRLFKSIFSVIARLLVNADCRCHSFGLVGWGSLSLNPTLLTLKEEKLGTGSDAATNAMQESQCVLTATGSYLAGSSLTFVRSCSTARCTLGAYCYRKNLNRCGLHCLPYHPGFTGFVREGLAAGGPEALYPASVANSQSFPCEQAMRHGLICRPSVAPACHRPRKKPDKPLTRRDTGLVERWLLARGRPTTQNAARILDWRLSIVKWFSLAAGNFKRNRGSLQLIPATHDRISRRTYD